MKKRITYITSVTLIIAATLLLILIGKKPEKQNYPAQPVRCQKIREFNKSSAREFSGVLKAAEEINLSFKVPGTINNLPKLLGEKVLQNEVVAELDDTDYKLILGETIERWEASRTMMELNYKSYQRLRQLYAEDNISLDEYEKIQANYLNSKHIANSLEKKVKQLKKRLGYTKISAPFSGTIGKIYVEENENINTGHPVVSLISSDSFEVEISVPDKFISKINLDDPVSVLFTTDKSLSFTGRIKEISRRAGRANTTFPVTIEMITKPDWIRSGLTAIVEINIRDKNNKGIQIPVNSVTKDESGLFVYLVKFDRDKNSFAKKKYIQNDGLTDNSVIVKNGLDKEDLIVTSGINNLEDGGRVKLLNNIN